MTVRYETENGNVILDEGQRVLSHSFEPPHEATRLVEGSQYNSPEYQASFVRMFGEYCEKCKRAHKGNCPVIEEVG